MAANRLLVEIPRSTDLSQLCGRRRGAVAGALGAQLRPKRGRSASRGLPRAARRPGAPPRPRRRRPARSAANGAAPKSMAPRSRGGSRCRCRARRRPGAETASVQPRSGSRRSVGRANRASTSVAQQVILHQRFSLCAGAVAWASRRATWSSSQLRRWCSRMSTTRRLLLPRLLARLGTRALNAPVLSAYRPDAVGAVARRSLPCLRRDQRAWVRPARGGLAGLPCGRGVFRPRTRGGAPIGTGLSHGSLFKVDQARLLAPSEKFQNSCVVAPVVVV